MKTWISAEYSRKKGIDDADIEHYQHNRNLSVSQQILLIDADQIQETLEAKLNKGGIKHRHTFYWEEAMQHGMIDSEDVRRITELRMIRNSQVHSVNPDRKDIQHAVHLAETLLERLRLK